MRPRAVPAMRLNVVSSVVRSGFWAAAGALTSSTRASGRQKRNEVILSLVGTMVAGDTIGTPGGYMGNRTALRRTFSRNIRAVVRCAGAGRPTSRAEDGVRAQHAAHRALQDRPGNVHPPDLVVEQGGAGVFRPGLPDDVRLCEARGDPLVPRGVEARSRSAPSAIGERRGRGDRT